VKPLIWVSLAATFVLLVLFPFVFGQLMTAALAKLHLGKGAAVCVVAAIMLGSLINIPVKRIRTQEEMVHPLAVFGLADFWPALWRLRQDTIIAVNVGGCLVPTGLAAYELIRLAAIGPQALAAVAAAAAINIAACYFLARPVPRLGIVMPGLIPPLVAAVSALMLAPDWPAPVAFVAGVCGPVVGADLLHLKDIQKISAGVASIGGAGTFDGIVLSGIVAAYLS
jgi:uncharacterized membrane protein